MNEPGNIPHDVSPDELGGGDSQPTDPEGVARLMDERDALAQERDALLAEKDKLLRHCADFQNQVLRARKEVAESRRQGITGVSRDVILALDHFDVALSQDMSKATIESIVEGMRAIRAELIRAMTSHGVALIDPQLGDEFDPARHEAVMRRPSDGIIPAGHIMALFQIGYMLDERVIRPAKVVVAEDSGAHHADV